MPGLYDGLLHDPLDGDLLDDLLLHDPLDGDLLDDLLFDHHRQRLAAAARQGSRELPTASATSPLDIQLDLRIPRTSFKAGLCPIIRRVAQ